MAASWKIYNSARKYLASGDIDLDFDSMRLSLFTSASNAADFVNLSCIANVTDEVAEANGYSSSGKQMTGTTWGVGASAGQMKFSMSAVVFIAAGGDINNIKHCVIWKEATSALGRKLLCTSQLSTAQFALPTGNSLTIAAEANGVFTLSGG